MSVVSVMLEYLMQDRDEEIAELHRVATGHEEYSKKMTKEVRCNQRGTD